MPSSRTVALAKGMPAADRKRLTQFLQKIVDGQTIGRGIRRGMSGKPEAPEAD